MSKARTLADFISDGSEFADGAISVAEVSGAAPLASPTFTGNVDLGDNVRIRLGDSDDLQIYHDGTHSRINDEGTGNLILQGSSAIVFSAVTNGEHGRVTDGGGWALGYSGTTKLATTSTGIDITGIADASTLFRFGVDNSEIANNYLRFKPTGAAYIDHSTVGQVINVRVSNSSSLDTTPLVVSATGIDVTGDVGGDTATITGTVTAGQYDSTEALPDVRPSLLLDFANSKTLDPRITFTRGSTATYWDGHTTTKAEENLLSYSQELERTSHWSRFETTVTANATTAPDGTTTAEALIETTSNNYHNLAESIDYSGSASFYIKANGRTKGNFRFLSGTPNSSNSILFDLSAVTVNVQSSGTSATITDVGNSWYRIGITGISNANRFIVEIRDNSNQSVYAGDGSSGFYIWGFQAESRDTVTAYTATTDSPIVKYQPTLQTAASGEARFDHDPVTGESKGLLIEESRTNLIAYSDFTNSSGYNNIFKVGSSTAPDGTNTATILRASADNQYCYTFVGGLTLTQNTTYTYSVFVKAANSFAPNYIWLLGNTSTDTFNFIDPSNGTVGTSASGVTTRVEDVGNGWYRCAITFTNTQATGAQQIGVGFAQTNGSPQTSSDETQIEVWGEQIEVGFGASSYIPTSGSTVTRSADDASIALTNEVSLQEATVYAEAATYRAYANETAWCPVWQFNDGVSTANGRFDVRAFQATYGSQAVLTGVGGSTTLLNDGQTVTNGEFYKYGLFWNQGSVSFYKNGAGVGATTNQYVSDTWDTLDIGWGDRSGRKLDGHIKKLSVYPQALSHNTMLAMTEA